MPDPVLHTERLVLRPVTAALAAALLDADLATEDLPLDLRVGHGFPRDDDRSVLLGVRASGEHAEGTWLVVRDGEVVGTVGVCGAVSPDGDQELGYGLVRDVRGSGLGTEAVGAVCAVLERRAGVRRLTARVLPGNEASLRLLSRLGFERVGEDGAGPSLLLARPAPGAPAVTGAQRVAARIAGRHVC